MTQKAKLTKAQAEAIKEALKRKREGELVEEHIGVIRDENDAWTNNLAALNELNPDTLCRAIYVGYVVVGEDQVVTVTEDMRADLLSVYIFKTEDSKFDHAFGEGMQHALEVLGVHIEGITDKEESE